MKPQKPQTDAELHAFIKKYLGFDVPCKAVCRGHIAPFQVIADHFFGRHEKVVYRAGLGTGKTRIISLLSHLQILFAKKPLGILYAASVSSQRDSFDAYMEAYWHRYNMLMDDEWDIPFLKSAKKGKFQYEHEGYDLEVCSTIMTYSGVGVAHPAYAYLDAIEMAHWDMMKAFLPITPNISLFSTKKVDNGTMSRMLSEAASMGFAVRTWCAREVPVLYPKKKMAHCRAVMETDDFNREILCQ